MKNLKKRIVSQLQLTFCAVMCSHPWPVQLLIYQDKLNGMALRAAGKVFGSLIIAVALIIVFLVDVKALPVIAGFLLVWLLEGYINYLIQSKKTMEIIPRYIEQLADNQEFIDLVTVLFPKEGKNIIYDPNGISATGKEFKRFREIKTEDGVIVDVVMVIGAAGRLGREIKIDFWITREVMQYLKTLGYGFQE